MKHEKFINRILWMFDEQKVDSMQEMLIEINSKFIILDSDQIFGEGGL